jgi:hypothetical protein
MGLCHRDSLKPNHILVSLVSAGTRCRVYLYMRAGRIFKIGIDGFIRIEVICLGYDCQSSAIIVICMVRTLRKLMA